MTKNCEPKIKASEAEKISVDADQAKAIKTKSSEAEKKKSDIKKRSVDKVKLIKELTEKTRQRLESLREFPVLLKTAEAARYLGISSSIMNQWRVNGLGPRYHKFEGNIRYSTLGLLEYVDSNEYQSTSQTTKSVEAH